MGTGYRTCGLFTPKPESLSSRVRYGNSYPIYMSIGNKSSTYDHTYWKIRDPVRSPRVKPVRGGLVVGSVTTSEYPLLYVFFVSFFFALQFLIAFAFELCSIAG